MQLESWGGMDTGYQRLYKLQYGMHMAEIKILTGQNVILSFLAFLPLPLLPPTNRK